MLSTGDLKWAMVKVPSYAPCQAGGRGHGPGKTPTGAWAPPCVQRVPERPGARHSCCRHKLQSPGRCRCGQRHGRSEGPEGPSRPRPLVPPLTWTLRRQRRAVGSSGPARTARTRPLRGRGHWGWAHRPGGQPSPRVCTPAPPPHPLLQALTELVEVRVTLSPGHRAHQPRLQERAPPVDQAALATHIILPGQSGDMRARPKWAKGGEGHWMWLLTRQIWPTRDTDMRPRAGATSTASSRKKK